MPDDSGADNIDSGSWIEGWGGDMLPIKDDIDGGSAFIGDGGITF